MQRSYDISMPIVDGGLRYPGDPEIRLTAHSAIQDGDAANVTRLHIGSHTGTHIDAPRHFLPDGETVDEIPLDRLMGPAVVAVFPDELQAIGESELQAQPIEGHRRVLLKTRNSALLRRRDFSTEFAYLAPDGAEYLARTGVELVGIDYLSIERFESGDHATHLRLLERGIVIVEGLDLLEVPAGTYELVCLPIRIADGDGAPARAILLA